MHSDPTRESKLELRSAQWRLALYVIWSIIGIGALAYFSGGALEILSIPVGIIVWTAIIVFSLRGIVNKLEDGKGLPRGLAVTLAFLLLIAILIGLGLLTRPLFSSGTSIQGIMRGFSSSIASVQEYVNHLYATYPQVFNDPTVTSWIESTLANLAAYLEKAVSGIASNVLSVAGFTVNALMVIMFSLVASFWLLLEMPRMRDEIGRLLGEKRVADVDFLTDTFSRVLGGFIKGMVVQCAVIGVGCGIAYAIIGFHDPAVFGFIVAICNILPILGQWVALVIIVIVCLFVDKLTAILVIVATFAVQRIVYTFIYPKIMADSVDVHPVMIIIAMMVGYALGSALSGIMGSLVGVLVSIPLAAVAKAMFVYYFEKRTGRHLVAEDGVFFKGVPNSEEKPDPRHNATSPHPMVYASKKAAMQRVNRMRYVKVDPPNAKDPSEGFASPPEKDPDAAGEQGEREEKRAGSASASSPHEDR